MSSDGTAPKLETVAPTQDAEDKIKKLRHRAIEAEAARDELLKKMEQKTAFPTVNNASMKRRHWLQVASFLTLVVAPLVAMVIYLWTFAEDQYLSTTGFTVRSQESANSSDLLGGIATLAGATQASDSDILYEYIRSQELVEEIDAKLDLRAHYAQHWPGDWVFAIWPDASLEMLTWYWQRIIRISYDSGSGLTEVRAQAYDPEMAQALTQEIVNASQRHLNSLNNQARADAMRYAQADLEESLVRLKEARQALVEFRIRTHIVDPAADIQGRMGVVNTLQQQLASTLVEYDLLAVNLAASDPRLLTAQQRIDAIRERINVERQSFASDSDLNGEDYPRLIAEYEGLTVDREYAEQRYRASLAAVEIARDSAARQTLYLATYINPTKANTSEYPRRFMLVALAALFLLMFWAITTLIYYSIRDRS